MQHAPRHIFIVPDEHAEELIEQAAKREVHVVVRAEAHGGAGFQNIQPDIIKAAAAEAANALLGDAHAPISAANVTVRKAEHRGGELITYRLRIACDTSMRAQALERAVTSQGALVMRWGDRENVPGMLLTHGQPTDAMYMLRITSQQQLRPRWLYSTLAGPLGITPVWVTEVLVGEEPYGEPMAGVGYWPGQEEPELGLKVHPHFCQGVAGRATQARDGEDRQYLVLVEGCHAAVNEVVAASRSVGKITIATSEAVRARNARVPTAVHMTVERFIPRLPKPSRPPEAPAGVPNPLARPAWGSPMVRADPAHAAPPPAAVVTQPTAVGAGGVGGTEVVDLLSGSEDEAGEVAEPFDPPSPASQQGAQLTQPTSPPAGGTLPSQTDQTRRPGLRGTPPTPPAAAAARRPPDGGAGDGDASRKRHAVAGGVDAMEHDLREPAATAAAAAARGAGGGPPPGPAQVPADQPGAVSPLPPGGDAPLAPHAAT
jgi:hypothetical protein